MKTAAALLAFLAVTALSSAEDLTLRQEAVQLLERAHGVSLAPNLPNLERTVVFRVLDSVSGATEGSFTRVVVQGTGRRDEIIFGDYHLINVWAQGRLATVRSQNLAPAEVRDVMTLTPIYLVRFDQEDEIFAITESQADGRPLRCIEFTTTAGQKTDMNQLCVDAASGTLVSERLGSDVIENSEFFPFAGALIPGRIRYSKAGIPKLEIRQTMNELTDPTPDVLAAPPQAQLLRPCGTFRRAIGESMPQPKPGEGGADTDILVRGVIAEDGRIADAVVQDSERPDLNADALNTIRQWLFTPAMCNGHAFATEASFVLHFRAR